MAFTEGDRLKLQGMARAASSEERDNPGFRERFLSLIHDAALNNREVHIDLFANAEKPVHPNCLGPIWKKAISLGWLAPAEVWRKSTLDSVKHSHRYPVYRSKIYAGTQG